jgi:hypothetical protein
MTTGEGTFGTLKGAATSDTGESLVDLAAFLDDCFPINQKLSRNCGIEW